MHAHATHMSKVSGLEVFYDAQMLRHCKFHRLVQSYNSMQVYIFKYLSNKCCEGICDWLKL